MKQLQAIFITISALFIFSIQCSEPIIRPATLSDLDAISALSHQAYQNHFKPLYSKITHLQQNLDDFVNEKEAAQNISTKDFITKQINGEGYGLLVAYVTTQQKTEKLAGYCRFKKENNHAIYMNFILVDEAIRRQGIAKQLAFAAMKKFDGVTECNFRAFIHDTFVNELYSKHNCINKGAISLDPNTGTISTDPNAPVTHIDYSYIIKKY